MLTVKEIVESIAKDKEYTNMCSKICPDYTDDLWQEALLILLEYDKDKLIGIYKNGRLKFFVCKILMNQAHSSTSPFHKKYRMREDLYVSDITYESYDFSKDKLIDNCLSEISIYGAENDNNWYRSELFKLYMQEGSMRKLSNKTGIPVMSIQRSLNEFKTDIKQRLNENTSHTAIKPSERNKLLQAINAACLYEDDESGNRVRPDTGM